MILLDIVSEYYLNILEYINKDKEECIICFEKKNLYDFCDKHKFCHKCCQKWSNFHYLCPCCRNKCTNKKYLVFNFELQDIETDKINIPILKLYFKKWHKKSCIFYKHCFVIQKINKNYIFYCRDCNIQESMSIIK